LVFLLFSGCDVLFFHKDPLVARVQGRLLRTSDINKLLGESSSKQSRDQFIEHWVDRQLWDIEAKKHVRINSDLRTQLEEYQSSLIIREYQESFVLNKIMVHESDVLKYYNEHQGEFITPNAAAFLEIYTTPSREVANQILVSLKKIERPTVPGQIKLVDKGCCIEPIDKAVFSKERKSIIGPIFHSDQYFVLSVIEYYPENSLLRVEHVRDDIIQKLQMAERSSALQQKQKELKDHINVKIFKTSDR